MLYIKEAIRKHTEAHKKNFKKSMFEVRGRQEVC